MRTRKGQSFVELAAMLMCLIPVLLVIFDVTIMAIGVQVNDNVCREATRVASEGDPNLAASRVQAYLQRAGQNTKGLVSSVVLSAPGVIFDPPSVPAQTSALAPYGGPVRGNVTVKTKVHINPYILQHIYAGQGLDFEAQKTFPITYVVPNTAPPEQ
jgi:hypothetical protein